MNTHQNSSDTFMRQRNEQTIFVKANPKIKKCMKTNQQDKQFYLAICFAFALLMSGSSLFCTWRRVTLVSDVILFVAYMTNGIISE